MPRSKGPGDASWEGRKGPRGAFRGEQGLWGGQGPQGVSWGEQRPLWGSWDDQGAMEVILEKVQGPRGAPQGELSAMRSTWVQGPGPVGAVGWP